MKIICCFIILGTLIIKNHAKNITQNARVIDHSNLANTTTVSTTTSKAISQAPLNMENKTRNAPNSESKGLTDMKKSGNAKQEVDVISNSTAPQNEAYKQEVQIHTESITTKIKPNNKIAILIIVLSLIIAHISRFRHAG